LNHEEDLPACQAYGIAKTGVIFCLYNVHPDGEEGWKPNPAHVAGVFSWRYHTEKKLCQPTPHGKP